MFIALGTLLRGLPFGVRVFAAAVDQLAEVCDSASITVSWEFAVVLAYLVANGRWGWLALSVTISFIVMANE